MQSHRILQKFTLISIIVLSVGCSHFAANKTACERAAQGIDKFNALFIGNVTQIGPCSLTKIARIETGIEVSKIRENLVDEIKNSAGNKAIREYAYKLGCDQEHYDKFEHIVRAEKHKIFGENFSNSGRQIVLRTRDLVSKFDDLGPFCGH